MCTDKLDLQDCLEHGRTAKVGESASAARPLPPLPPAPFLTAEDPCLSRHTVRQGADHHHQVQLHQAGQGPALPRLHEREGGHSLVHRDGKVGLCACVCVRERLNVSYLI